MSAFLGVSPKHRHGLVVDPQHAPLLHLTTRGGVGEESSEESAFRQWMVSLGVPLQGSTLIQALRDG